MHKCLVVRGRIVFWALLVLLLGVLAVGDLQAQVEKATLSGTALDASGAVVAGATIQAKNLNTGIVYSAVTDGQGRYILPEMAVGTYDVSAEKAGFQKMVQTGIVLTVGARPVLDFKLAVGQPVEVVEVQGQASTVDTDNGLGEHPDCAHADGESAAQRPQFHRSPQLGGRSGDGAFGRGGRRPVGDRLR